MPSCKTLAAYRSIDTYKFVRSTPRIPADDEHMLASRQCHVTSKHFVVSSRSMTSDRQRQLHNLTETVDASPRAAKYVTRSAAHSKPSSHWIEIVSRFVSLRCAITLMWAEPKSNCQFVTGRTVFFFKSAELECTVETSRFHPGLGLILDITACTNQGSHAGRSLACVFRPRGFATRNTFHIPYQRLGASLNATIRLSLTASSENHIHSQTDEQH
jgi:hypothetical protein